MNKLNDLMIGKGLTQKEIAIAVGVSRPTVSDWVNNRKDPKGQNLQNLANYLDVDWHDILIQKQPASAWTPDEYTAHGIATRTNLTPEQLDAIAIKVKALIGAPSNLTPAEQELVDDFRLLSNAQKSRVRAMIAGYLDAKFGEE